MKADVHCLKSKFSCTSCFYFRLLNDDIFSYIYVLIFQINSHNSSSNGSPSPKSTTTSKLQLHPIAQVIPIENGSEWKEREWNNANKNVNASRETKESKLKILKTASINNSTEKCHRRPQKRNLGPTQEWIY